MGQFTDRSKETIHGLKQWGNSRIDAMGQFTDRNNGTIHG